MKKVLFLISLMSSSLSFANQPECNSECKLQLAQSYFDGLTKISITGSTSDDIKTLINQLHDEVRYQHVEYGADFTKVSWEKAFLRQLQLGSYTSPPNTKIMITNIIYGKNHAAVEYSYGTLADDGSWVKGHMKLALIGFKDSKIVLIKEFW
jgi:hypothetical protein